LRSVFSTPPTLENWTGGPAVPGADAARYWFRFGYEMQRGARNIPLALIGWISVGAALWCAGLGFKKQPAARHLAAASVSVILFNGLFHSIFGVEPILYSLHWQGAVLVLAMIGARFCRDHMTAIVLGPFVIVETALALRVLSQMTAALKGI